MQDVSVLIAEAAGLLISNVSLDAASYRETTAGLLSSAVSTFVASLILARQDFRRQYGSMARGVIETLCTVIHIAVEKGALERFHADDLQSTKSIGVAKRVIEPLGPVL
ncbi:hypothetical protein [Bradyrhizobium sp. LHD-71]|uniref:hypothetical protein n=1 Tax=Bradyrhizobium sp. LHD-71 TaxID=3072141 RepID=UPI00280EFB7D|nr:hypothetical protein [Bradyrhizobium sp. LHD-71]MDQ8732439.1 hypothetical protein [Bradyrhizobium sp. LHD-71]